MYRRIGNNCGIEQVKNSLRTETKIGLTDIDFLQDVYTVRFKLRFKHIAYFYLLKISDEVEDAPFIQTFKNKAEEEVARKIWRLNDKRVRHNLESWI